MLFLLTAADLLLIFLSVELISFCLYVLTCTYKKSFLSIEAGLKYFVLGSIASGFLLFGISIIYSFTGTTNLIEFSTLFFFSDNVKNGIFFGIILILFAILFKMGSAPFHFWVPDIYEGVPLHLTLYFLFVPKFTFVFFFFSLIFFVFFNFYINLQIFLFISIITSLFVGNFTAVLQIKLKRLFAYSAIAHLGFIFTTIYLGTFEAFSSFFFYLVVYFIIMLPIFVLLMYLNDSSTELKRNSPLFLRSFLEVNPTLIFCFTFLLLSLGGLPPLLGFFSKFFIIYSTLSLSYYFLSFILILFSCLSFYYYLQFVIYSWGHPNKSNIVFGLSFNFFDSFFIIFFTTLSTFFIIKPFYIIDIIDVFVLQIFGQH